MAIDVQRISLTHEKLHFLHYSVREVIYEVIDVLGYFSVILQPRNFFKVEFTDILVLVGQREKSHKYFDLSTFNSNLNDSKP